MKKPFENKEFYDPGRLRNKVKFVQDQTIKKPSGGTSTIENTLLETWAGKDNVSGYTVATVLNEIGATVQNDVAYFVIRNRDNFYPDKTMFIRPNFNEKWQIHRIKQLDEPVTFIQLLCVRLK